MAFLLENPHMMDKIKEKVVLAMKPAPKENNKASAEDTESKPEASKKSKSK